MSGLPNPGPVLGALLAPANILASGPVLGALDQASVMGHDLVLRQVKGKFQGHQHWELEGDQLSSVQPELLLQFLQQKERKPKAR